MFTTRGSKILRKKLGRNAPCWCGSGRKYKHCHLDREKQTPLKPWEAHALFNQAFATGACLAPNAWRIDCSGNVVKSHTVPKSSSLQRIAREGHVYSYPPKTLLRNRDLKNLRELYPELQGINRASTFSGFCSRHDRFIFAPLETHSFSGSLEQCFLIGYRALSREIYNKHGQINTVTLARNYADKGKSYDEQMEIQNYYKEYQEALKTGIYGLNYHKSICDTILVNRDFCTIQAYIIEFEDPPPVMCSGGFYPEQDFNGTKLQNIMTGSTWDILYFVSFYDGRRGIVAFYWLSDNDEACRAFIESLDAISDELVTSALLRCFFMSCDNIHIKPDWWETLPDEIRKSAIQRIQTSMTSGYFGDVRDDGIVYPPWRIVRRYHIS